MKYFDQFPIIVYNKYNVKNILAKVKLDQVVRVSSEAYYPYTLEEFDKPWMIAADYYGDPNLSWLVYMANDIIDPYYDWYMDTENFDRYIAKKYGSVAAAQSQLMHYKERIDGEDTGRIFSPETYIQLPLSADGSDFANISNLLPVYAYDYEDALNEDKRTIRLINKIYARQAEKNLKKLLEG